MSKQVELRDENGTYIGYCESLGPVYADNKIVAMQLKNVVLDDEYVMKANVEAWKE